ncbi:MAG: transaldolase family protein [Butyricicoccus sp.]|nr:transaldolase family protein [Butyricicoccus sp.]
MELYVDTADLEAIRAIDAYFPIDGFTTNPKLLSKAAGSDTGCMAEYRAYIQQNNQKIFFQVTGQTAEQMLEQAKALQTYYGKNFIVKIPATKEGYRAVRLCKAAGIPVTVTVVHSLMQALVAAKAGADYVAPYVSHIDNLGADGVGCVADMVQAFRHGGYACRVLGASFRTVDQIKRLAVAGCHGVTLAPELFEALIAHPSTTQSVQGFDTVWTQTFGTKQVSDLLP